LVTTLLLGAVSMTCHATPALAAAASSGAPPALEPAAAGARCTALAPSMTGLFSDASTHVVSATLIAQGPVALPGGMGGPPRSVDAPAHCEVMGIAQERVAADGQHYAIRFHVRMPLNWNGKFFFQGGGGSNGELGDALGIYSAAAQPALTQGFAVVSQDSGHDNRLNNDPARGGVLVFGFDEKARANYGHASLPVVAHAAKALVKQFYGSPIRYSYFVGCSKGGEEGMAFAQKYPTEFDGIAASAPGMSLPRAAVEEAWDTQALAAALDSPGKPTTDRPFTQLASAFSDADLVLVRDAVLGACDADDGVKDGIVGDFAACTQAKVQPALNALRCSADKTASCLSAAQIGAITRLMQGAQDSKGNSLYAEWAWDAGIGSPGWRVWKLGNADGRPPALNVILGGASLASDFTTPPTPVSADPQRLFQFLLGFDFDRDAPAIYATNAEFPRSAWDDISARSADLSGFRAHHGKLLVPHGVSDPVFSVNDTLAWWHEVDKRSAGLAATFVRVFPVPGMNHCGGGAATDRYDVLASLTQWVEKGKAPDSIPASAGPGSPWPNRTRPICAYPAVARYKGSGDIENAANFVCRR
jgi:Tannase and feruloyl esterase